MALFDPVSEQLERRSSVGRWQVVRTTFTEVDTDLVIPHSLPTPDPEQVSYQVLNITGPGVIYHDGSPTRSPWGRGFIRLRARVVPVTCDLLLTVMATEIGTTRVPQGSSTTPTSDADTLDGLDSTAFAQNAFKTITVATQTDVVADSPDDTLELEAGTGITITTNSGTDKVTIAAAAGATDVTSTSVITDNAIVRGDGGSRGVQESLITISDTGLMAFPDDVTQVFNPGTNNAGINVGSIAGDPATPDNGDVWYDSTANELTARINGANVALGAGGSSSMGLQGIGTFVPPVSADFSWVNQNSASVSQVGDGVVLTGGATGSGDWEWAMRVKSAPSTPYIITAYIVPSPLKENFRWDGLIFRQSSDGKFAAFGPWYNTFGHPNYLSVRTYSSPTAFNGAPSDINWNWQTWPHWLQIEDDGTDRFYRISSNGMDWIQIYTEGRTTYFTADQVGFGINRRTGGTAVLTLLSWEET